MATTLSPCTSCSRHVKTTEARCPFCQGALADGFSSLAIPGAPQRLTRAATFAFTASLAVTGCGSVVVTPPRADGGTNEGGVPADDGGNQALYGLAPQPDAGFDSGFGPGNDAASDASFDANGNALYGAPAISDGPFIAPIPK